MKILVTRTAPFGTFERALNHIRARFPDAELYVLTQRSVLKNLSQYGDGLTPIVVEDGPFSLWQEGLRFIRRIRKERFDLVILLYANPDGRDYASLDLLSLLSGAPSEMVFDIDNRFYPVSSRSLKLLKRSLFFSLGLYLYTTIRILLFSKGLSDALLPSTRNKKNSFISHPSSAGSKKIVFVDLMFTWPPHGGACVDLKEVACRLVERGYDVDLIVPDFTAIFPRGKVQESQLPFTVHVIPFTKATFNSFILPKKFKAKVDSLNPDFVYLGDSYFLKPFLIEALKRYKIVSRFYTYELLCPNNYLLYKDGKKCEKNYFLQPTACMKCAVHGMRHSLKSMFWNVWSHEFFSSFAFMPSYHKVTKKALASCHTIITYNDLATGLLKDFSRNVVTFPGGVNVSQFSTSNGVQNRVKKIFVSGRLMDPRKGLTFFIQAIRRLRKTRDDFEVFLTYDQKYHEDYITSLGWLDHEEIKRFYTKVDICVVPSLWEEPFGMVAVEAMAAGKPVVASNVGGLKTSITDNVTGILFPSGDEKGLAESLSRLLDDPFLMKKMGEAGRQKAVKYFDWDRIVDRYCEEIFEGKENV